MRTQSEKSFERRLTGAMWKGLDKALPERVLPLKPSPLISTLSEKDLFGSKEQLASPVSTVSRNECKRKEALWDLFQSECAFLYDHLMVLNNVSWEINNYAASEQRTLFLACACTHWIIEQLLIASESVLLFGSGSCV